MYLETDLYYSSWQKQYASAFYHAVEMLNGGEVGPRTINQYAFVSSILILGAIINANVFGTLAVLISQMNEKGAKF